MILRKKLLALLITAVSTGYFSTANAVKLNVILPGENIADTWTVHRVPDTATIQNLYKVEDYPKEPGRTYGPLRTAGTLFDSMVLSQTNPRGGKLGDILRKDWIPAGKSTHFFVGSSGVVVEWIDPTTSMGQMAGPKWNPRSVEALLQLDNEGLNANPAQLAVLPNLRNYVNRKTNIDLRYAGSHQETGRSEDDGKITNIDAIRADLGLNPLPK